MWIWAILAAMNTSELVVEIGPEKNSGSYGIWTQQANWELVIMLDPNKPMSSLFIKPS